MALPKSAPQARDPSIQDKIRKRFRLSGSKLLKDGKPCEPGYPHDAKRPRSVYIGKSRGKTVVWAVGQLRLFLHLGDLPADTRVLYLDGNPQNDALDNLKLIRRSADRTRPAQSRSSRRWAVIWEEEPTQQAYYAKGVKRWGRVPIRKGDKTYPRCEAWIRIGDNELLLGLFDAPWDAQKAIQAARDAAWHAVLSPNDHERMAAMRGLIRKRRSATVLKDIAAELERLDPPTPAGTLEPDIVSPTKIADALIHDGWHRRRKIRAV